jgi:hypothetical protein
MQANLGLLPNVGQPTMTMNIKSPAQMAAELSAQATANLQYASSIGPQVARNMPQMMSFGQQFQQQFQAAQQMQSFNPYMANMMGSAGGYGGGQMNLPSPIMMTPANTGVFRPQMPSMGMQPIAPMAVMPVIQTPFTPQIPRPQFQTAWEQELQQRDYRADSIYSYAIQAPRMGGNMAGYGAGAMAGAMMGGRMGRPLIGAAMGMVGAGMSGLAGGMGDLAMMPFRPSMETHQMGASVQRMSQDWVVGGSQMHAMGRGLTRGASMDLSKGIMDMTEDRGFKQQTGGMFSRHDMANILQTGGRAGLMDFTQNTDQIKEQLRRTALSLKKFMELTNDPDVSGIIRKMADLQRLGYGPGDMEGAAYGMRRFSRGAGTTIDGIMQMGGAGAMTYQGMGLSAASGMQYGMFSAMAARQSIASGVYSPAQAALLGGQSGIAQRNMQAQAAMMSMPLVGASMASFQGGSWGVDYNQASQRMSGRGGAAGFVMGAAANLGRAVQSGGVGALAMYPLQAGMMQDEVSRAMSPEQQTAMRFQSALATGKQMGLKGAGAFALGSRMMFGDEVATQMLKEASSPQYWKSLKDSVRRQQNELAVQQFQDIKDNAPGFFGGIKESLGAAGRSVDRTIDIGASRGISRFFKHWGDENRSEAARESGQYYYAENTFSGMTQQEGDVYKSKLKTLGSKATPTMKGGGFHYRDYTSALQYLGREDKGSRSWGEAGLDAASTAAAWMTPLGLAGFDYESMQSMMGAGLAAGQSDKNIQETIRQAEESKRSEGRALNTSDVVLTGKKGLASAEKMGAQLGLSAAQFAQYSSSAGGKVAKLAGAGQKIVGQNNRIGTTKIKSAFVDSLPAEARAKFNALSEADQAKILQNVVASGKGGATAKEAAGFAESEAFFNEGKAGWENAQAGIKRYQGQLDFMLGDTMGMSSDAQEDVTKWMKGTKESVQYATALGLASDPGNTAANEAKLTELVTKEMPGAKKSAIKARVVELMQTKGGPLSANVKDALMASRDKLGDTKFRAALDVSNQTLVKGQTASAIGAMKDILGDVMDGGKINAGAITSEKIASLKASGHADLAEALSGYKSATKGGINGTNERDISAAQNKVLALIGQGGADKSGTYESLTAATGEQAQQLAASAKSLDGVSSSMAEAFKYFTPAAAKNFAEGAKALAETYNKAVPESFGRDG